jgi:hypothetical protein
MPDRKRNYTPMIAPAVAAAVAGVAYFFALRPWHLRWGATDEELAAPLPGDALSPNPKGQATHAITIDVPPEEVWPWILQIGQDRGGFYSYTFLENLIGCDMRNTFHIVPEWQTRAVGDTVWFGTPKHFRGVARMIAAIVEPDRAMVFATPADWQRIQSGEEGREGTWSLVLNPIGQRKTRLITRSRAGTHLPPWKQAANLAFWEPAHFVMERKMLLTIKRLAENHCLRGISPATKSQTVRTT